MTINITYLLVILVGIYVGIVSYIKTKHQLIIRGLVILLISLGLELQWLNLGTYNIDTTDFFRTTRDIARTILTIIGFRLAYTSKKK